MYILLRLFVCFFFLCIVVVSHAEERISPYFKSSQILTQPYGMTSHPTYTHRDYPCKEAMLEKASRMGFQNVRLDYLLPYTKTIEGSPEAQRLAEAFAILDSLGVAPLAIFAPISEQKRPWQCPEAYDHYIDYVIQHYPAKYWEAINEINCIDVSAETYYNTLKRIYRRVKNHDSSSIVTSSGFANLPRPLLDELCQLGFHEYFDIFSFHTYDKPEALPEYFSTIRRLMNDYGWEKPVWLSECGMATHIDTLTHEGFFRDFVPLCLNRLGVNPGKTAIGVLNNVSDQVGMTFFHDIFGLIFRQVNVVQISQLKRLDVRQVPVLVASASEAFPMRYKNDLLDYVRRGGTIILSKGAPLYFDQPDGNTLVDNWVSVGDKYYKDFHIGADFWWKNNGAVKNPTARWAVGEYSWPLSTDYQTIYLNESNLQGNDSLFSLIEAGSSDYRGCIAGIYRFDSDLHGNIIFQTRVGGYFTQNSEMEQARRLARIFLISFAYGVEKVFWYNMRSWERDRYDNHEYFGLVHPDLTDKPAAKAFTALQSMCPNGSSRPILEQQNDVYICSWEKSEGEKIWAVWTTKPQTTMPVRITGKASFYDFLGNKVSAKTVKIQPDKGVIYIKGAKGVLFSLAIQ